MLQIWADSSGRRMAKLHPRSSGSSVDVVQAAEDRASTPPDRGLGRGWVGDSPTRGYDAVGCVIGELG
jgi:hypothetical protein